MRFNLRYELDDMDVDYEKSPFNDARTTTKNEIIGIGMNKSQNY